MNGNVPVLEFTDVSFRYRWRERPVLQDFSLAVQAGRTILLGPNGAGKSTLLSVGASAVRPSAGRVSVGGLVPRRRRAIAEYRRRVAWMPQSIASVSGLSVREQVALHGWLAGMSRSDAWERALSALRRVSLHGEADRRAGKLSGGQRARMGLAQALVHDAEVLLLDEPTAALDPDQKDAFTTLLGEVSRGRTVVVSTHEVAELAGAYDHVVVLDGGRVRFRGTVEEFLHPVASGPRMTPVEAYRAAMGRM